MATYLLKRILLMFVTMFGICLVSFVVINLAPGDPADKSSAPGAGGGVENQAISDLVIRKNRERLFLDKPILFNTEPSDRDTVCAQLMDDLLSDDDYVVRDVLKKGRLVDLGTVALPALVARLETELDARQRRNVLGALKKVTSHWSFSADDPRSFGEPDSRSRAWIDDWSKRAERTSFARGAELVELCLGDDQAQRGPALSEITELGRFAVPALMARYRADSDPAPAARLLSQIARKPWDLTIDGQERASIEKDWQNRVDEALAPVRRACEAEGLTAPSRADLDDDHAALTKALEQIAKGDAGADVRATARIAATRLGRLDTKAAQVALVSERELSDHRRGWRNWWQRKEEYYVRFAGAARAWRMFTDTRFGHWSARMVVLDFGESYTTNRPVIEMIGDRFGVTLKMNFWSLFLTYLLAIPIGIYSSTHQYSFGDRLTTVLLFILYSLPTFWVGTMMIWLVTGPPYLDWFPSSHAVSADHDLMSFWAQTFDSIWHLTLPVICLTYGSVAYISRQMRAGMLETVRQDFIRTARAKGLSEPVVIYKHALRNSLIPILTLLANLLPLLIGGSVIIEQIFSIEGLGKLSFEAVLNRDYPVIMTIFTFSGFLTLLGILLSDITYAVVDPRISYN